MLQFGVDNQRVLQACTLHNVLRYFDIRCLAWGRKVWPAGLSLRALMGTYSKQYRIWYPKGLEAYETDPCSSKLLSLWITADESRIRHQYRGLIRKHPSFQLVIKTLIQTFSGGIVRWKHLLRQSSGLMQRIFFKAQQLAEMSRSMSALISQCLATGRIRPWPITPKHSWTTRITRTMTR